MNGIFYQFRDFEKLEGIYIVPEDDDDIPIIGINNNRPITRQRFTAAHKFASELLMPRDFFNPAIKEVIEDGYVSFDNALKLSVQFGVSFTSCVFTLAYRYGRSLIATLSDIISSIHECYNVIISTQTLRSVPEANNILLTTTILTTVT